MPLAVPSEASNLPGPVIAWPAPFSSGDDIEFWSYSRQRWLAGKVTGWRDRAVCVKSEWLDDGTNVLKEFLPDDPELRKCAPKLPESPPPEMAGIAAPPGYIYQEGVRIEMFSKSLNKWLKGKVVRADKGGVYVNSEWQEDGLCQSNWFSHGDRLIRPLITVGSVDEPQRCIV